MGEPKEAFMALEAKVTTVSDVSESEPIKKNRALDLS